MLAGCHSGVLNVLLGDGTVHSVSKDALPLVLTQLARTADGNVVALPQIQQTPPQAAGLMRIAKIL